MGNTDSVARRRQEQEQLLRAQLAEQGNETRRRQEQAEVVRARRVAQRSNGNGKVSKRAALPSTQIELASNEPDDEVDLSGFAMCGTKLHLPNISFSTVGFESA